MNDNSQTNTGIPENQTYDPEDAYQLNQNAAIEIARNSGSNLGGMTESIQTPLMSANNSSVP